MTDQGDLASRDEAVLRASVSSVKRLKFNLNCPRADLHRTCHGLPFPWSAYVDGAPKRMASDMRTGGSARGIVLGWTATEKTSSRLKNMRESF